MGENTGRRQHNGSARLDQVCVRSPQFGKRNHGIPRVARYTVRQVAEHHVNALRGQLRHHFKAVAEIKVCLKHQFLLGFKPAVISSMQTLAKFISMLFPRLIALGVSPSPLLTTGRKEATASLCGMRKRHSRFGNVADLVGTITRQSCGMSTPAVSASTHAWSTPSSSVHSA